MPYRQSILFLLLLSLLHHAAAQEIEMAPGDYYYRHLLKGQQAIRLPYVRGSDVIWSDDIWRVIDVRERDNQFFYYPIEPKGISGRKNLAYVIWDAIVANEIEVYEDDEMLIPKECQDIVDYFTRADTLTLEVINDEDEESYEYRTVFVPREFVSDEIFRYRLREKWYIDKQINRQQVRIVGLAPVQEQYKDRDGEREYRGSITLFWLPMLSPRVRHIMATHEAYFERNLASEPAWEEIFTVRMFSSYITRESNVKNRPIDTYLTGIDAILESERIELRLMEINYDMWEY